MVIHRFHGFPQIKSIPGLKICVNLKNLWINPFVNNPRAVKGLLFQLRKNLRVPR
jgi:hypothetical protein